MRDILEHIGRGNPVYEKGLWEHEHRALKRAVESGSVLYGECAATGAGVYYSPHVSMPLPLVAPLSASADALQQESADLTLEPQSTWRKNYEYT